MLKVSWSTLKNFVDDRNITVNWIVDDGEYNIVAIDGPFILNTKLTLDPTDTDTSDFEDNYKTLGNQSFGFYDNTNNRLRVDAAFTNSASINFGCPVITDFRAIMSTADITLSTSEYTSIYSNTGPGVLFGAVFDLTSDKVDVQLLIDGNTIFDINLDHIEDLLGAGGSSDNAASANGKILWVGSGSRLYFTPPCALSYTSVEFKAKAEDSGKKVKSSLIYLTV